MPTKPLFGSELEYQTLREELLSAKKYVFERPLVISTLAIAGLKLLEDKYLFVLPLSVSLLLLFNFWFTVNRLMSAARIVAYVQLELEESVHGSWIGWETCLRYYRKWLKSTPNAKEEVDKLIDREAIPDALMYYPPIYYFHVGMIILSVIAAIAIAGVQYNTVNVTCAVITFTVGCFSGRYFFRYKPDFMRTLIERNRVIWHLVFERIQSVGEK